MPTILLLLIGLHLAAGVFWLFSSAILGWGGNPGAARSLFRAQMIAAVVAVFAGGGLWQLLHGRAFGAREAALAAGALAAIVAAGVQGGLVGGPVRRIKAGAPADAVLLGKIAKGERIAAVLLLVALACMMLERVL